jgi:hypothetical protein
MEVLDAMKMEPNPEKATLRYARAMATVHAAIKQHPDYELAYYCAAISDLGNKPHHTVFDVFPSVLVQQVLDDFDIKPGTVASNLLHFAMENAANLAQCGALDNDPHFASFLDEAAQIELLTLIEGNFSPEDLQGSSLHAQARDRASNHQLLDF